MASGEELLCCEAGTRVATAGLDRSLLTDRRVLANLLRSEQHSQPSHSYVQCVQQQVDAAMRRVLAFWMAEVCEESGCQDDVLPLAMNLLDRFLSVANVRKQQLQLTGAVCLFISSKLRESRPLTAQLLVQCTDNSVSLSDMLEWEVLVLHKLQWQLGAVTASDFVTPLLQLLPSPPQTASDTLRRTSHTLVLMCATDYDFLMFPASMVAASCVTAAVGSCVAGSRHAECVERCLGQLKHLVGVDLEMLRGCWRRVERLVQELCVDHDSNKTSKRNASTPTDLFDINF